MSSRALRKLQREQEARQQSGAQSQNPDDEGSEEDGNTATEMETSLTKKFNAFDMLNIVDGDGDVQDGDSKEGQTLGKKDDLGGPSASESNTDREDTVKPALSQSMRSMKNRQRKKNKKKKKKQGAVGEAHDTFTTSLKDAQPSDLDEIDVALLTLRAKDEGEEKEGCKETELNANSKQLYALLATDTKNLNSLNEMKRLFGSAVLSETNEAGIPGPARRRGRGPQQLDLGGALAGQNSPVSRGHGLAGLALRRNVFMQGKEEWPKATSGGLGMEIVERAWDFTTEYRFVHNPVYQDVQKQFESCVELLDPQRMIQLLQFNPYHISTILQVSEIAKQQGDHSISGDLLERALFSFGRSVHSSFHTALAQGEARLDFRYRENREFFLASWRYISNLGQRGTWRTAYEWAKLLLSFDPEGDPYEIKLLIDQLALRGGQPQHFLDLASVEDWYQVFWEDLPNIRISKALAEYRLQRPVESRATLRKAILSYPWIFSRMFQELNISPVPKSIWGKKPRTDREKFESEVYVVRAKDLWNTPESTSLLVEVANSIDSTTGGEGDAKKTPISLNEARHVMLADIPTLISLLPRTYTSMRTSAADPLPPLDDLPPYISELHDLDEPLLQSPPSMPIDAAGEAQELRGLRTIFSRIAPWLGMRGVRAPSGENSENVASNDAEALHDEEFIQALNDLGDTPAFVDQDQAQDQARMLALEEQVRQQDNERRQREGAPVNENPEMTLNERLAIIGATREDRLPDLDFEIEDAIGNSRRDPSSAVSNYLNFFRDLSRDFIPEGATVSPPPGQRSASNSISSSVSEPYDDERNQRWLVGQGMQRIIEFTKEHGTDENVWLHKENHIDTTPIDEYVRRVRLLLKRTTKNVVLEHHLHQRAGTEVRDLMMRLVERGN